ncbi:MAG: YitT family protein [Acholeplasmataceae bacterium]
MTKLNPKTKFHIKQYIEITLGVILMTLGFYFFFIPLNINSGGVGGLSIVLHKLIDQEWLKISYLVYAFNIGLLILAYFTLGKKFFFRTLYPTVLYPTIIFILEIFGVPSDLIFKGFVENTGTSQLLIASLFGSLIVGYGLGIVFNNNTTTGGMDIVQKLVHKYLRVPYSVAIYGTDGIIVVLGLFAFNIEVVLYGVIAVFIIGLVVDKIIFNGRLGFTAFIITNEKYEEKIKNAIINDLDRGLTKAKVTGGYTDKERTLIICTIGRNQTFDLKEQVLRHDPKAFTFIVETREVVGYGFELPED